MMIEHQILSLDRLGILFETYIEKKEHKSSDYSFGEQQLEAAIQRAEKENAWFTQDFICHALSHWGRLLKKENLEAWLSPYPLTSSDKTIGIVCAGNIPLVGLHDFLCAWLGGNLVQIKLSSKDSVLMRFILQYLTELNPEFEKSIRIVEKLENFDKVIATGSENTSRYFDYYFRDYPNIIRKNRTSIAVLDGSESEETLEKLGDDIFLYFGLGCRNVSKLFLPQDFDLKKLEVAFSKYKELGYHNKFSNNYDYHKAIFLLNVDSFQDLSFYLMRESEDLFSPLACLYYEYYSDEESLNTKLIENQEKIQCFVGNISASDTITPIPFGETQKPKLDDYADNVDTLSFLTE